MKMIRVTLLREREREREREKGQREPNPDNKNNPPTTLPKPIDKSETIITDRFNITVGREMTTLVIVLKREALKILSVGRERNQNTMHDPCEEVPSG